MGGPTRHLPPSSSFQLVAHHDTSGKVLCDGDIASSRRGTHTHTHTKYSQADGWRVQVTPSSFVILVQKAEHAAANEVHLEGRQQLD